MSASAAQTPPSLPSIESLPSRSDVELKTLLDTLFEPSPDLHALALPILRAVTFASYEEMINKLRGRLLAMAASVHADADARKPLYAILGSHPRLGEKKVESALSRMEQAALRSSEGGEAAGSSEQKGGQETEADQLARLNREYEEAFPGLRYVVFVNGRGRDVIMADMTRRIGRGDAPAEEREAIEAMCDIAISRAEKIEKAVAL